jgi:uncharacterized protein (DUF885 family)
MAGMPDNTAAPRPDDRAAPRPVRDVADGYVRAEADLDPFFATSLGLPSGQDQMPDLSPAGTEARVDLIRSTLAALDALPGEPAAGDERRCARLLRERLSARLAMSEGGEHLREVSNVFGPLQKTRNIFTMMPTQTAEDWAVVARRMSQVPAALDGYRASLAEGMSRGLLSGPRPVQTVIAQLADWLAAGSGAGWYAEFTAGAPVPGALRANLDTAAAGAVAAVAGLRSWLADSYLPRAAQAPDGAGEEAYLRSARFWTGASLDLAEVREWGWAEYRRLRDEIAAEARHVLPGAGPAEAMRYLDEHSPAVDGVEHVRERLQEMMDTAIDDLDGTHFDIAGPIRRCEAMIAPAGAAAAPYYTGPSQDFARPGRTWLPTLGQTRFPVWSLISTWYHEGVPGHHLQIAQWVYLSDRLSQFQTTIGGTSACLEGWALYAERLMDELGYLRPAGARIGYLDAQLMRAVRVVVDTGMHLGGTVPDDSPVGAGQAWTPDLAAAFMKAHSGRDPAFVDSEIVRYLSAPGQAITYKLGERAWLAGRAAARAARGASFDLKAWHMAALSLGSLGLDDLTDELAAL